LIVKIVRKSKLQNILGQIQTPAYVCEEELLEQNLKLLAYIQKETGAKILLALKGFAFSPLLGLVGKYLYGCCASGLYEARYGAKFIAKEVHTYSPAFKEEEIDEIISLSHHLIFNSFSQWHKYKDKAIGKTSCGLRINPEISCAPVALYDPCTPTSRFGIKIDEFKGENLEGIEGLHFHALCEQDSDALQRVLQSFEAKFAPYLKNLQWVNFGGGHHITKDGYNVELLLSLLKNFKAKYPHLQIYLEPGEAVGWQTGGLVVSVLDIIDRELPIAIVDSSAEAHMPDTLAMPYRANIRYSGQPKEKKFSYLIGGNTCLSGDIIGKYSFDTPLKIGDKLILEDMIHYTIVKNTTFNGIKLPSLATLYKDGTLKVNKEFGYEEYERRN